MGFLYVPLFLTGFLYVALFLMGFLHVAIFLMGFFYIAIFLMGFFYVAFRFCDAVQKRGIALLQFYVIYIYIYNGLTVRIYQKQNTFLLYACTQTGKTYIREAGGSRHKWGPNSGRTP